MIPILIILITFPTLVKWPASFRLTNRTTQRAFNLRLESTVSDWH